jgi:hypothetical protein
MPSKGFTALFMIAVISAFSGCAGDVPSSSTGTQSGISPSQAIKLSAAQLAEAQSLASRGDERALKQVIDHYMIGIGDPEAAVPWLRIWADTGNENASLNLALLLPSLHGRPDCDEALSILGKLSESKQPEMRARSARYRIYLTGEGKVCDPAVR